MKTLCEALNESEIDDFYCGIICRKRNELYTVRKQLHVLNLKLLLLSLMRIKLILVVVRFLERL